MRCRRLITHFRADNGCAIRMPHERSWKSLVDSRTLQWRRPVFEILSYYTERTPGAWIEDRGVSICWRYLPKQADDVDIVWSRRQAAEVQNHIMDSLGERFGLHIVPGATGFLVMPKANSCASALEGLLDSTQASSGQTNLAINPPAQFDCIVCFSEDDRVFSFLKSVGSERVVTCGLGTKAREAYWTLEKTDMVFEMMDHLLSIA